MSVNDQRMSGSAQETGFNAGSVYNMTAHKQTKPGPDDPPIDHVRYNWPIYMIDHGESVSLDSGDVATPTLVDWSREGHNETFVVDFRGSFNEPSTWQTVGQAIAGALSTPIPNMTRETETMISMTFSHYKLPEILPWEGDLAMDHHRKFLCGRTANNDPVIWNTSKQAHAMAAGLTGSGKTELLKLIIAQALAEHEEPTESHQEWEVLYLSPTTLDSTVDAFRDTPRFTDICGTEEETVERQARALKRLMWDIFADRTTEITEAKRHARSRGDFTPVDMWGVDLDGWEWSGRRILVAFDEADTQIGGKQDEESWELKKQVGILRTVAEGRKAGIHLLVASQAMYASTFGPQGGKVRNNIGFATGLFKCNEKTSELICGANTPHSKLLQEGLKCPGRGISLGADELNIAEYQAYYVSDFQLWTEFKPDEIPGDLDAEQPADSDVVKLGTGTDWKAFETVSSFADIDVGHTVADDASLIADRQRVTQSPAEAEAELKQVKVLYLAAAGFVPALLVAVFYHWILVWYVVSVAVVIKATDKIIRAQIEARR